MLACLCRCQLQRLSSRIADCVHRELQRTRLEFVVLNAAVLYVRCADGHQFAERHGHARDNYTNEQRAPIFIQVGSWSLNRILALRALESACIPVGHFSCPCRDRSPRLASPPAACFVCACTAGSFCAELFRFLLMRLFAGLTCCVLLCLGAQWLDCVFQLWRQFPSCFEFNEVRALLS